MGRRYAANNSPQEWCFGNGFRHESLRAPERRTFLISYGLATRLRTRAGLLLPLSNSIGMGVTGIHPGVRHKSDDSRVLLFLWPLA